MKYWRFLSLILLILATFVASGCQDTQYDLTIFSNGSGSTNPSAGTYTFNDGKSVTIIATPDSDWKFDGWSGDASGDQSPLVIEMDEDKNIIALFSRIQYGLTMSTSGEGTTIPPIGVNTYYAGDLVNIIATPAKYWKFDNWSGDMSGTSASISIEMNGNHNISANFSRIEYTLTINSNGQGAVTPQQGQSTYYQGSVVTVSATPADGWGFSGWSGDVTNSSPTTTVVVNSDMTVVANFYLTSTMSQQYQNPVQTPLSTALITRTYQWSYGWRTWTWQPQFSQGLYDYYRALPRPPTTDYSVYITNPYDDDLLTRQLNTRQNIENILQLMYE